LRLTTSPLLGPLPCAQRLKGGAGLVELPLQGLQPRLELVLAELGDQVAFSNRLPLLDRQLAQNTGHLKGELNTPGGFDSSRKSTHARVRPRRDDHRFDRSHNVDGRGILLRATDDKADKQQSDEQLSVKNRTIAPTYHRSYL
jgi:hypothetical protein